MFGRDLDWILERMTPRRWTYVGLMLVLPWLVAIALLLGIAFGAVSGVALVAAIALLVQLMVGLSLAFRLLRRRTALRAEHSGHVSQESRSVGGAPSLHVADIPVGELAAFGIATRAGWVRDSIALRATQSRFDYAALHEVLSSQANTADVQRLLHGANLVSLAHLSRLAEQQALSADDAAHSKAIAEYVAHHPRSSDLPRSLRLELAERLIILGARDAAITLLDGGAVDTMTGEMLTLDTLNPFVDPLRDVAVWMGGLNAWYRRGGLDPLRLADGPQPPLERIRGTAAPSSASGPLVTVIMTTFEPNPHMVRSAVQSIVDQSWADWELVIVDDGSPADSAAVLDQIAAMDSRIAVHRQPTNLGTFVARNEALRIATGELVTFHDSDDWAHPQRLELQARHLAARPRIIANIARGARVTPEMLFSQPRGAALRLCESTLMFRRKEVATKVGFFDAVRRGGDSGFRRRIEAASGSPVAMVETGAPMMLVRFSTSSLSGPEIKGSWMHPARVAYSNAVDRWMAQGNTWLPHPLATRPYCVPKHIEGEGSTSTELDVLYVLDPSPDPRRRALHSKHDAAITSAVDAGLAVGVLYARALCVTSPGHGTRPTLQDLVNSGRVVEVFDVPHTHARLAVILNEAILMGIAGDASPILADQFVMVPRSAADRRDGVRWSPVITTNTAVQLAGTNAIARLSIDELADVRATAH